jgi:hypothetical protein
MSLTTRQYDALERAITDGKRLVVRRPTYELVFVPERIRSVRGGEVVEGRHPVTGAPLSVDIADLAGFEVV